MDRVGVGPNSREAKIRVVVFADLQRRSVLTFGQRTLKLATQIIKNLNFAVRDIN